MNTENLPEYLTSKEVADLFRVAPATVSRWRREGRLDSAIFTTPGGRSLYRTSDIIAISEGPGQDDG